MPKLFGEGPKHKSYNLYSKEQKNRLNDLLQRTQGPQGLVFNRLQALLSGDPSASAAFEAPYLRQFREQIIPGISEQFAGMGSHGALSSSGFQQSLGSAAAGLSERLAAMREQLAQGAMQQLPQYLNLGLQQQKGHYIQEGNSGILGGIAGAIPGIISAGASMFSSPSAPAAGPGTASSGNWNSPGVEGMSFGSTGNPVPGYQWGRGLDAGAQLRGW